MTATLPGETTPTNFFMQAMENRLTGIDTEQSAPPVSAAPETAVLDEPTLTAPKPEPVAKPQLKQGLDSLADVEPEEPDDAPPDAKTPEARNAWSAIKAEAKTLRAEKDRLAAELAEAKKLFESDPVKQKAEALEKERAEWQQKAALYHLEDTDEWKRAITEPEMQIGQQAVELSKLHEIPFEKIEQALIEPDRKKQGALLAELVEDLDPLARGELQDMAVRVRQLTAKRKELEANAGKALEEAKAKEADRTSKARNESRAAEMRSLEESRAKLTRATRLFRLDGESDEDAVKAIMEGASAVPFDELEVKSKSFSQIAALLVPRMEVKLSGALKEVESLKKEIASLTGSAPRAGAAAAAPAVAAPTGGFIENLKARMAASGF